MPLVILGGLIGWRVKTKSGTDQQLKGGMRGGGGKAQSVEAIVAGPATIAGTIIAAGSLDSPYKVQLAPRTAGKILSLSVREGDAVTAGQTLVKIDPATAIAGLNQAEANLAQAQARLAQARIEAAPNSASVSGQIDQQGAALKSSQAELTQTQKTVDANISSLTSAVSDAQAKVDTAQASLTTANANLAKEKSTRENLKIKADRAKELLDQGYIAQKDWEDATTALDVQDKQVQIAIANVASAKLAVQTAKNQSTQAQTQLDIAKTKGKADIAAAKAKVNQSQSSLAVAKANKAMNPAYDENIKALSAAVAVTQAQVAQARVLVSETDLKSSINGVVTARNADEGALASPGNPVLVIQSLDWLFFVASIPVEQGDKVHVGQSATIQMEGIGNKTVQGSITSINPSADPASRQIALRIRVENPDHRLRPGMFGKINFPIDARRVEVALPKEAITYGVNKTTVAVVGDDNKIQIRNVVLGVADETTIEIKSGVKPGEKVVTLSYNPLKDGTEVKIGSDKADKGDKPDDGSKKQGRGKRESS
ncbi:MAG: efflux RND transporter periplasmic adaptor subunit [Armatimonadetes bacterium]|nr:efflux RND transporter periplasmic adaptor subunit [Armatimonadota bacterium]